MRYANAPKGMIGMAKPTVAGAALGALLAVGLPALATTYKWVDEHGVVHYTDKVPPEQIDKARVELSKDGVPVRKIDPAMTAEQRKAKEAEEARQRELARVQEDVARKNKALLQSYTSEAEIELARKRALSTLDGVIQSAVAYTEQLNKRKEEVERKKAEFGNKPIPAALEREATTVDVELVRQNEVVAQKRRESADVQAKYDAILARWRELTNSKEATEAAMSARPAPSGGYATEAPKK